MPALLRLFYCNSALASQREARGVALISTRAVRAIQGGQHSAEPLHRDPRGSLVKPNITTTWVVRQACLRMQSAARGADPSTFPS